MRHFSALSPPLAGYLAAGSPFIFLMDPSFPSICAEAAKGEEERRRSYYLNLLEKDLEKDKNNFISQQQKEALLDFDANFDQAKAALKEIIAKQIQCAQKLVKESLAFECEQKTQLQGLIIALEAELGQKIDELKEKEDPKVFVGATQALMHSIRASKKAIEGRGNGGEREEKWQFAGGILGGLFGVLGLLLGGPVGLVVGVFLGILLGVELGEVLATITASKEEEFKARCAEFRRNPSQGSFFKPSSDEEDIGMDQQGASPSSEEPSFSP